MEKRLSGRVKFCGFRRTCRIARKRWRIRSRSICFHRRAKIGYAATTLTCASRFRFVQPVRHDRRTRSPREHLRYGRFFRGDSRSAGRRVNFRPLSSAMRTREMMKLRDALFCPELAGIFGLCEAREQAGRQLAPTNDLRFAGVVAVNGPVLYGKMAKGTRGDRTA